jgi:hypothetical protein
LLSAHRQVDSAAFVDADGECVDYASRIDPYEAQVAGAQMLAVTADLVRRMARSGAGALIMWTVEADQRDFVVRRVSDEHCVVVASISHGVTAHLLRSMVALADALRLEADLAVPGWDTRGEIYRVDVRPSVGFGYAPQAVSLRGGAPTPVEVLGRWTERGFISAQEIICFRVRCEGRELTLTHDRALDRWHRR